MTVKLLTEHHLGFLSLKEGCKGSSESPFVKMPHCWKSHVTAHISIVFTLDETLHSRCLHFSMQNIEQSNDLAHALDGLTITLANEWLNLFIVFV